jgi:GT2 family glycosyltransferase
VVLGEPRLDLTIVISTRNRGESLRRLVKELNELNCELIVVDDYSKQPVVIDEASVIRNTQRLGSGESKNVGCRQAKCDWLLLLDDDLVPSPGLRRFIDEVLPRLETRDVVGFRIVGSNAIGSKNIDYRNTGIHRMLNIFFGVAISPHSGRSQFIPSAMMFPSGLFASLEGFDSDTFQGNGFREESDLQWRARKVGARITYVEDPFFLHLNIPGGHNKRHSENDVYYMRNQTIFALKTAPLASLVMIASFGAYLLVKGVKISTLIKGVAHGLSAVLQG